MPDIGFRDPLHRATVSAPKLSFHPQGTGGRQAVWTTPLRHDFCRTAFVMLLRYRCAKTAGLLRQAGIGTGTGTPGRAEVGARGCGSVPGCVGGRVARCVRGCGTRLQCGWPKLRRRSDEHGCALHSAAVFVRPRACPAPDLAPNVAKVQIQAAFGTANSPRFFTAQSLPQPKQTTTASCKNCDVNYNLCCIYH